MDNSQTQHSSNAAAIAAALWDSGQLSASEPHFRRALDENPEEWEALYGLGRLKLAQNDLAAAVFLLERALERVVQVVEPRSELTQRVRRELAWALYRLDRFDLAASHFRELPESQALASQLETFAEKRPYSLLSGRDEISIPFLGTDPLPIIPLVIEGREYPFVIDTGSNQLVIDASLAADLGLPLLATDEATFASGQRAQVGYTSLPSLSLGDATLGDVPAELLEIRQRAPQLAGLIGTHLLQRFHVHCDWEGQYLRLRARPAPPFEQWSEMTAVPFWYMDSHLLVAPATLNEHETLAYIASGMAGAAFTVPTSTVEQARLLYLEDSLEGVGAGGSESLALVDAERVCLGEYCRQGISGLAGFFPSTLMWRYGYRIGVLIAHEYLRGKGRATGFDFSRGKIYLF